MDFMEQIRTMTRSQVMGAMIEMLPHTSSDTLAKLLLLASRLTDDKAVHAAIGAVQDNLILEGEHGQAVRLFRRVMTELSPHCLKTMAQTLFINGFLYGANTCAQFAEEHGFQPPFTLLISPTMQCNLRCQGCYSGRYVHKKGLSYDLLHRILNEAQGMGIQFIVLSGGELLTRKEEVFQLAEEFHNMYFMFYTNGTLIDDTVADRLYELGNVGAIMSLEGFEEATDARRGKGVYQKVMDAMERLKIRGVPFGTSLTVTRHNLEEVASDAFFEHLTDKGVMVAWFFLFMPVGKDPDVSFMPTPGQRAYLLQRDHVLRHKFPIFLADFWNDGPYVGGCIAAGRNYLHINANGDVEPCVFTHTAVDNIAEKSLVEVLESEFFKTIRSRQPYSENLLTPCMIIDHPHVYREIVQRCGAYPTHDGASDILTKIPDELDDYGKRVRGLFGPIWEREKAGHGYDDSKEARHDVRRVVVRAKGRYSQQQRRQGDEYRSDDIAQTIRSLLETEN